MPPVQDDDRERELCRLFNLVWDPQHQRSGVDAFFDMPLNGQEVRINVEVKSTTGDTVSTARDVGPAHIEKWGRMFWVFGFYTHKRRELELESCLCLTPADMAPWIEKIKEKILPDFQLAQRASARLAISDLNAICGEKASYDVDDAKRLHKSQWSREQYNAARDVDEGGRLKISAPRMLEILQLRARYIAERGATLNNPHIEKGFLRPFIGSDREVRTDWALRIRSIVDAYLRANPGHPFLPASP